MCINVLICIDFLITINLYILDTNALRECCPAWSRMFCSAFSVDPQSQPVSHDEQRARHRAHCRATLVVCTAGSLLYTHVTAINVVSRTALKLNTLSFSLLTTRDVQEQIFRTNSLPIQISSFQFPEAVAYPNSCHT